MAKENTPPLAPIIKAQSEARLDFFVWAWRHKVAIIVCAVLSILGFQFREALWAGICWTWNAGRSVSASTAERIDDSSSTTSTATDTYMVVKDNHTNVRESPSTKSARVATLKAGTKVYPTGKSEGGWIPVKLEDGTPGFIRADLVRSP